jgi:hypothetical protein
MIEEVNHKKLVNRSLKKNSSNSLGQSPKFNVEPEKQESCVIENSSSNRYKEKKKTIQTKDSLGRKLYNFKNNYQGQI